jgi:hypothetical protein
MKMFLYVAIDNSLFFRSKFGDADPDGARVVVDEEQVRRDAAVLAEGSGAAASAQPAAGAPQSGASE